MVKKCIVLDVEHVHLLGREGARAVLVTVRHVAPNLNPARDGSVSAMRQRGNKDVGKYWSMLDDVET
jgi:hypothetical protein